MDNIKQSIDYCLLSLGVTTGIANIESVLGVVTLCIQALWLLTKLIVKIVKTIKNKGDLSTLEEEVHDVVDFIHNIGKEKDKEEKDTNE